MRTHKNADSQLFSTSVQFNCVSVSPLEAGLFRVLAATRVGNDAELASLQHTHFYATQDTRYNSPRQLHAASVPLRCKVHQD